MFEKKYKELMDDIEPSDKSVKAALSCMNNAKPVVLKRTFMLRIALISIFVCVLTVAVITSALNNAQSNDICPPMQEILETENNGSEQDEFIENSSIDDTTISDGESTFSQDENSNEISAESNEAIESSETTETDVTTETDEEDEMASQDESVHVTSSEITENTEDISEITEESLETDIPLNSETIEESSDNQTDQSENEVYEESEHFSDAEETLEPEISDNIEVSNESETEEQIIHNGVFPADDYQTLIDITAQNANRDVEFDYPIDYDNIIISPPEDSGDMPEEAPDDVVDIPAIEEDFDNEGFDLNFSHTNNQTEGIQEADIVKTDGNYIYSCRPVDTKIFITKVNGSHIELTSTIQPDEWTIRRVHELLLFDNKLAVIGYFSGGRIEETVCCIYDISNASNPILLNTVSQDGKYVSCREKNGLIYIVSRNDNAFFRTEYDMPKTHQKEMSPKKLLIPTTSTSYKEFCIVTSYDINGGKNVYKSEFALLSDADSVYMSENYIYILEHIDSEETVLNSKENGEKALRNSTRITRFALNNGNLYADGSIVVEGSVSNQFSMDERNGKLRAVANLSYFKVNRNKEGIITSLTLENQFSRIYIFDEDLKQIGICDNIGLTEDLKAVRFIEDTVYFATFRLTDPLFAVDLSNPKNPIILSELKTNGYSTHLIPIDKTHLFGIGYDADANNGNENGIKLSIFDISDPKSLAEISSLVYSYDNNLNIHAASIANQKAIMINKDKKIIAITMVFETFKIDEIFNECYNTEHEMYVVFFEYSNNVLKEIRMVNIGKDTYSYDGSYTRIVYIGDYCYAVTSKNITCISLLDFNTVCKISFD